MKSKVHILFYSCYSYNLKIIIFINLLCNYNYYLINFVYFKKMSIDEYLDKLEFLLFTFLYSIFLYIKNILEHFL
jgi:hypothetical protein